jgi:cytidine deaminase
MSVAIDRRALVAAAARARNAAYAPYSSYQVGAAVLSDDGRVFEGCNVENASYGLTICAERNAITHMVACGARRAVAIAVVTRGPEAGTPCGVCRQTLAEFASDDLVVLLAVAGQDEPSEETTLGALLPRPFRGELVKG